MRMMRTRPLHGARSGVLVAAVLVTVVGCATGAKHTPAPPTPSGAPVSASVPTAVPTPIPTDTPTAAPSVAPSVAPSIVVASPAVSAAPSGAAVPTERPGPTPIVGEVGPAPEFVDLVVADGTPSGTPFTLADLRGETTLVFFGYTNCPDVCPATIGELIGVLQARPDVRVVFVTIDPERDTPEFLAEWTKYLPEGLVGVTGSPLAIRHAADSYGARYARVDTDSRSGYSMSHTAFQYLIDGEGNLLLTYPFGTPAAAIIGDLDALGLAGKEEL